MVTDVKMNGEGKVVSDSGRRLDKVTYDLEESFDLKSL